MNIAYKTLKEIELSKLKELYLDAEWTAYAYNDLLLKSIIHSAKQVFSAWHKEKLVGLTRVIGHGTDLLYIQDILVKKEYQKQGIEKALLEKVLQANVLIPKKILLTEDPRKVTQYYKEDPFFIEKNKKAGLVIHEYII